MIERNSSVCTSVDPVPESGQGLSASDAEEGRQEVQELHKYCEGLGTLVTNPP